MRDMLRYNTFHMDNIHNVFRYQDLVTVEWVRLPKDDNNNFILSIFNRYIAVINQRIGDILC